MKDQEILARDYRSGQEVRLRWRGEVIRGCEPVAGRAAADWWLAPGLLDTQVNGFAGVDFQADQVMRRDLVQATRALRAAGCTRYFLTLITDQWDKLTAKLRRLRELRAATSELQLAIAGWHLEGPFLSAEPGYHGAHNPAWMLDPTPDRIRELRALTADDTLLLTLAPERGGAIEAIRLAVSLGMKVSLGHTNASQQTLAQAVAAGATGFTHLANACPQTLDRHDNILWRVLDTTGLTISLIPDGIHVSPALFRLIHRVLPRDSISYTTDAMAAASMPPGRYHLGRLTVEVGEDQVVREPGKTNLAGSALRPVDGVLRAAQMLGSSWRKAWHSFSVTPAKWLGLPGSLEVGERADFCLLKFSPEGKRLGLRVFWGGQEIQHFAQDPADGES